MALDPTIPAFAFPPDWSELVRERLEFRTDGIPAMDGSEQTRQTRLTPRRRFEFAIAADGDDRRALAALAWARGARRVYLPLWTEGVQLDGALVAGSDTVPAAVAGLDFGEGGVAILLGPTARDHELVEVSAIEADHLELASTTTKSFPAGTWLHPVRRARLDAAFTSAAFNRSFTQGRQRFLVDEPNPFPAWVPGTTYRGFPVLTTRPSYARDPETSLDRHAFRVDDDLGLVNDHDEVGIPLYRQVQDWNLHGRDALNAWRAMVYGLNGKRNSLWVPTWLDDLRVVAPTYAGEIYVRVAWCGYTQHIAQAVNRRDVRLELASGAVYYRRIVESIDNGDGTERLKLDTTLPVHLFPEQVAQASFMGLCRSDSDQFELGWWRGDYADVTTAWRARQHDV